MQKRGPLRIAAACLALALIACLAGCAQQPGQSSSSDTDGVAANRQYMSAVNQASDELAQRLDSFIDAVSRNDAVTMRTQADNAYQVLDQISALEVPEDLTELHEGYTQACDELKAALDGYIDLYSEVESNGASFDYATYADRVQAIQSQYSAGIDLLESTDKKATELQK